jgi:hypothetical protein
MVFGFSMNPHVTLNLFEYSFKVFLLVKEEGEE